MIPKKREISGTVQFIKQKIQRGVSRHEQKAVRDFYARVGHGYWENQFTINPLKLSLSVLLLSSSLAWSSSPRGFLAGSNSLTDNMPKKEALGLMKDLKTLIERTHRQGTQKFFT